MKKGVLRNFAKLTGKPLCQSLFFNKVAGLRLAEHLQTTASDICCPCHWSLSIPLKISENLFSGYIEIDQRIMFSEDIKRDKSYEMR